jgi:hypothetical protein
MKTRLIEFLRALLPDGAFWRLPATERYLQALAAAVEPLAQRIHGLASEIIPSTADRAVLLQWWEAVRSGCVATPVDTEELREKVLSALGASPAHTPAGLQSLLDAALTAVELSESLPVSNVPGDVPMSIEPTGRILELWYMPLIEQPEAVRCVARGYAPAGDELRLVAPDARFGKVGELADEQAIFWRFARAPMDLVITRVAGSDGTQTETTVELSEETSTATLASLLSLAGSTNIADDWLAWRLERDGTLAIPEQHSREAEIAAIVAAASRTPEHVFFGRKTDSTGAFLAAAGTASAVAASGLVPVFDRVFDFDGSEGAAFSCSDLTIGSVTESLAVVIVVDIDASTEGSAIGKMDGLFTAGWLIYLTSNVWATIAANGPGDVAISGLTATSSTIGIKRVLALIFDFEANEMRFGSDLENGITDQLPSGPFEAATIPLILGDVGFPPSFNGRLGPVALFRGSMTGVQPQALAAAVRAGIVL